jgi:V-ATPase subunit H
MDDREKSGEDVEKKVEGVLRRVSISRPCAEVTQGLLELGEIELPKTLYGTVIPALTPLLAHPDILISLKACQLLTRIFSKRRSAPRFYYAHFVENFSHGQNMKRVEQLLVFLQSLASVDYRHTSWKREIFEDDPIKRQITRNTELVGAIMSLCTMRQPRYQALVLLWILSFGKGALRELETKHLFPMLSYVCKESVKEKEIRVVLAIARNYLSSLKKVQSFQVRKIEDILSLVSNREFTDPEAKEDLEYCRERFSFLSRDLSSFDAYLGELHSGQLQPLHYHFRNDFWKNNANAISDGKTEILKRLKRYLKSGDVQNVWVAANDLYRIISVCPGSLAAMRQFGIHEALFEVLKNPQSEDVKFHVMEALSSCYSREG